jgi:hypothetical protein
VRIVLLTNGHPHGLRIAAGLAARDLRLQAVLYEARLSWTDCRWTRLRSRSIRNGFPGVLARWVWRRLNLVRTRWRYRKLGYELVTVSNIYDDETTRVLAAASPDLLVLGGIGIIDSNLISQARLGVLNGHPGLLPWLRGVGVVARAVERSLPVGATCHFVDHGIDTGRIIERRLVAVSDDMTLAALEAEAEELAARILVDVVAEWPKRVPDNAPQGASTVSLCRPPDANETSRIEAFVRDGAAVRAFQSAVAAGIVGPDYILPPAHVFDR